MPAREMGMVGCFYPMAAKVINPAKVHYQRLRALPFVELWETERVRFEGLGVEQRVENVGVVRAIGVVAAESGDGAQRELARRWMLALLGDGAEKVRRYAVAALPKLGAGEVEERALLELLKGAGSEREREAVLDALRKFGGKATLAYFAKEGAKEGAKDFNAVTQRVAARVVREEQPGRIKLDAGYMARAPMDIHLRCRKGLEELVADEAKETLGKSGVLRAMKVRAGVVSLRCVGRVSLGALYGLRCFGTLGFVLGTAPREGGLEAVAGLITGGSALALMKAFTEGPLRYRIQFCQRGHQREGVRRIAEAVYAKVPELLNDPSDALWSVEVHDTSQGVLVELCPKAAFDPRFNYRTGAVPAASHPPLAACMARVAGSKQGDVIWDPFCGSALELIERGLLGGVTRYVGTDLSAEAIATARANLAAAGVPDKQTNVAQGDFRDYLEGKKIRDKGVTLVVSNPPMGRRVPIKNLGLLIDDLFRVAERALNSGGRLVFVNPCRREARVAGLKLVYRKAVDMGGFTAYLERYDRV